ncbi:MULTISPECIES: hypothetical protein [Arsenophonus]|nr:MULTISPECIES: hypothetical protein [Arsenophonus]UBX27877.1 hypothetical protein LDL57_08205 [Arsenophonus apicola]
MTIKVADLLSTVTMLFDIKLFPECRNCQRQNNVLLGINLPSTLQQIEKI